MRSKITLIIALILKTLFVYGWMYLALKFIDSSKPLLSQGLLVYVLIYLPLFLGVETIISLIFNKDNKK